MKRTDEKVRKAGGSEEKPHEGFVSRRDTEAKGYFEKLHTEAKPREGLENLATRRGEAPFWSLHFVPTKVSNKDFSRRQAA